MDKKISLIVFSAFILLLSVGFASAGLTDWILDGITGRASTQATNVSLFMKDTNPVKIITVSAIPAVSPTEASTTTVTFSTEVYSFDKLRDINFSSVYANFTNGGVTRSSALCSNPNNVTIRTANFSCSITMNYWDSPGTWNVNVWARDIGNGSTSYNTTTSFTYNQLKAMVLSPNQLTWTYLDAGLVNQTSTNDPTQVNNTGNYNGTIDITAISLLGEDDPSDIFGASNFTAGLISGAGQECVAPTSAVVLANASLVTVTNSLSNPGDLSLGGGSGQEEIYYCIPIVPNVTSQTYSTLNGGSWTISY